MLIAGRLSHSIKVGSLVIKLISLRKDLSHKASAAAEYIDVYSACVLDDAVFDCSLEDHEIRPP